MIVSVSYTQLAFMDGDTLDIGAVAAIKDFANPVSIARRLSHEKVNSLLVAEGAEKFAHKEGFERKNMLTDRAKAHYRKRVKEVAAQEIKPYSGHDTVGMALSLIHIWNFDVGLVMLFAINEGDERMIKIFFDWVSNVVNRPEELAKIVSSCTYEEYIDSIMG